MKNKLRSYVIFVPALLLIVITLFSFLFKFELLKLDMDSSFHFSLITINSIFAGFLYTNYSLLLGLSDNEVVKKLKNSTLIEKRNKHILSGILSAVISVIAGLVIVIIQFDTKSIPQKYVKDFLVELELLYMALSIIFFLLSIKEIHVLIQAINSSNHKKTDEELDEIRKNISGKRNK